jgi:hypothetical protein
MRRWLLDLHLYLGLLCLPYVVVFGVSSILMNHRIQFTTKSEWQARVAPLGAEAPEVEADRVWHALDRSGKVKRSTVKLGGEAELRFEANRPGRRYQVVASSGGRVSVVETHRGVVGMLKMLHGFYDTRASLWFLGWTVYTELTTVALVGSILSGAILALQRASSRSLALWTGGLGVAAAGALVAGIW